jgi:hypothetical protein
MVAQPIERRRQSSEILRYPCLHRALRDREVQLDQPYVTPGLYSVRQHRLLGACFQT